LILIFAQHRAADAGAHLRGGGDIWMNGDDDNNARRAMPVTLAAAAAAAADGRRSLS